MTLQLGNLNELQSWHRAIWFLLIKSMVCLTLISTLGLTKKVQDRKIDGSPANAPDTRPGYILWLHSSYASGLPVPGIEPRAARGLRQAREHVTLPFDSELQMSGWTHEADE